MEQVITNGLSSKAKIVEVISSATKEIRVAMAYFTDKDIANELIKAAEKGVIVSVILSNDPKNENIKALLSSKCNVYVHNANGRGIMHHKFCIIDNSLLLHGSYNYTYNASNHNEESLNITNSLILVSDYNSIFENLIMDLKREEPLGSNTIDIPSKDEDNYLQKFIDELKNHISQIFDEFNYNEIVEEGKKLSEKSEGQENVYISYLDSALDKVNSRLHRDDQTRVIVKTRMNATLERVIITNKEDLESDLSLISSKCKNQKEHIQSQIDTYKEKKKGRLEDLNKENAEFAKLKNTNSELKDEIDSLDRQIVVRKFWNFPTIIKLTLSTLFLIYLSIFFGSAIWKIFFEKGEIMKLLSQGITPDAPPLFDADALQKIYTKKGGFYGGIATLFFLVPILLTSIKLLVPNNKAIEIIVGWIIGIFAIDVVVSILISQHTFEIQRLATGSSSEWALGNALQSGEFWLIFIFGSLPLFLTKFLISNIWTAYSNSNPEFVDRERFMLRNSLKRKVSDNEQLINIVQSRIDQINLDIEEIINIISEFDNEKVDLEAFENNKKFELTERCDKKNKSLREIFNSFISSVDSGNKLFLQNIVSGRITAFKQGFFLHLTSYYHPNVATKKIEALETTHNNWTKRNFN